jgi:hypothetical protein
MTVKVGEAAAASPPLPLNYTSVPGTLMRGQAI